MRGLNLAGLKTILAEKERKDRELREQIHALLGDSKKLKDVQITKRGVVLTAMSKAIAQELFLQKTALEQALKKEITIR